MLVGASCTLCLLISVMCDAEDVGGVALPIIYAATSSTRAEQKQAYHFVELRTVIYVNLSRANREVLSILPSVAI